jgi:hypothetical protein
MTKHHKTEQHKPKESCCHKIADHIFWGIGWIQGAIVGCLVSCYVEEILDPGLAEEMFFGAFRGFEETSHFHDDVHG